MAKIYGFTFLKNGTKFDYPFIESITSIAKFCDKVYIALGDSEDDTNEQLEKFDFLERVHTVWDPKKVGDGALILSEQTNIALKMLRDAKKDEEDAWGFYIQCDEVIHEEDIERIKRDCEIADKEGYDSVRFRYLHFWMDHHNIAISRIWYPQEIRLLKLNTDIWSAGDAQSFKGQKKVFESDAFVYHYGHVRDEEKREQKQNNLIRWTRPAEKFKKYKNREVRRHNRTETLKFYANHPEVMKDRVLRFNDTWEKAPEKKIFIVGNKNDYSENLIKKINAEEVIFVSSLSKVPKCCRDKAINMKPSFLDKIFRSRKVPASMKSPIAREWDKDFILTLELSKREILLRKI